MDQDSRVRGLSIWHVRFLAVMSVVNKHSAVNKFIVKMATTGVGFRWLDILEKEFDKACVELDTSIGKYLMNCYKLTTGHSVLSDINIIWFCFFNHVKFMQ